MRYYVDLKNIYSNQELDSENYTVKYSYPSAQEVEFLKATNACRPWYTRGLEPNAPYVTLFKKGEKVMMSDVPMEKSTNQHFIDNANGDVLICGLGIGLIIFPLLQDPEINSITIIEMDAGLIDMVSPIIKKYDTHNKLTIILGDAFKKHNLIENKKFDSIYFDIWISIIADNFKEMEQLNLLYKDNLKTSNSKSFMDSWCYDYCKKLDWMTSEFILFLKKEYPGKSIDVERERLFIDGIMMSDIIVNDSYLSSNHRYSFSA